MVDHPGAFVRQHVIPHELNVTKAAKLLGIGRQALSSFLNGNTSLSEEMALRLEKTFGANREKLTELQREFDKLATNPENRPQSTTYVPHFLSIKANQISDWANGIDARARVPVLLRRLIASTTTAIEKIDFPGFDNSQRKGWDGELQLRNGCPWVPDGLSGWEFGCDKNVASKANSDYEARTKSIPFEKRLQMTFVFVTPRNWEGKKVWQAEKTELREWKAVLAMDASDIEQWLEHSVPAQIWLAEELGLETAGFRTLDDCWQTWAEATEPHLNVRIFASAIATHKDKLLNWLGTAPQRPLSITADSREEAVAFLAAAVNEPELELQRTNFALCSSAETLRRLCASNATFIPVVESAKAEQELIKVRNQRHSVCIRLRDGAHANSDIELHKLTKREFESALTELGIPRERFDRLDRDSARSLTILRRQLAVIDSVKRPNWADDVDSVARLRPLSLIGSWSEEFKADKEVIALLAQKNYEEVESDLAFLLRLEDSPVWSVGGQCGIGSRVDLLFAIAPAITRAQLDRFFLVADAVLNELDPALELPEEHRWLANIKGKVRNHSKALRKGVCETLILLALYGNNLFRERLNIDVETQVSVLVRKLLTPFSTEKLLSHDRDLPLYAEAAPSIFLGLLGEDVDAPESGAMELIKPVANGIFSSCSRTSILWSLECIAWNPSYLADVCLILAKMCKPELDDNWQNKPINSLKAIFRAWLPQTNASMTERIKALNMLCKRFPSVGWQICMEQIRLERTAFPSYKPLWREYAGETPPSNTEIFEFRTAALNIALSWGRHDETTLSDLVSRILQIPPERREEVWNAIETWAESATDVAKAALRSRLRRCATTRDTDAEHGMAKRVRQVMEKLRSDNLVIQHKWLFEKDWLDPSYDELTRAGRNYDAALKNINEQRKKAILDIWDAHAFEGVAALANAVPSAFIVGAYFIDALEHDKNLRSIVLQGSFTSPAVRSSFMRGLFSRLSNDELGAWLSALKELALDEENRIQISLSARFGKAVFDFVNSMPPHCQLRYWQEVKPGWHHTPQDELAYAIDKLLEVGRPRAAFAACGLDWSVVDTRRIQQILTDMVSSKESPKEYQFESFQISNAFEALNERAEVSETDLANLEFRYLNALEDSDFSLKNLEQLVAKNPGTFVELVSLATKRSDGKEDPPHLVIQNEETQQQVARTCSTALTKLRHRICSDSLEAHKTASALSDWVQDCQSSLTQLGRRDIGDQFIGMFLARHECANKDSWPCPVICEALESSGSEHILTGFRIQTFNSRGGYWGTRGRDEANLAKRYKLLANEKRFEYPKVARLLEQVGSGYEKQADYERIEAKDAAYSDDE